MREKIRDAYAIDTDVEKEQNGELAYIFILFQFQSHVCSCTV